MPPKKTVLQLIDVARSRSEEAARALGIGCAREQEERSRLRLLTQYRDEYLARFSAASSAGLEGGAWANYNDFILKLDAAIRQQTEVVERCRHESGALRAAWQAAECRLRSFSTLEARRQVQALAAERRSEQRELDEFVTRTHRG